MYNTREFSPSIGTGPSGSLASRRTGQNEKNEKEKGDAGTKPYIIMTAISAPYSSLGILHIAYLTVFLFSDSFNGNTDLSVCYVC